MIVALLLRVKFPISTSVIPNPRDFCGVRDLLLHLATIFAKCEVTP